MLQLQKRSKSVIKAIAAFAMISAMFGCSRGEVEIRNTVTAYTRMLSEALAKPDPNLMEYFTTLSERQRIDTYILLLRKDKKILVSTLKKLDIKRVKRDSQKKATVLTTEQWIYTYVDEKSRQPVSGDTLISYSNEYHLIEEQGHWVVERVDVTETGVGRP